MRRNRGYWVLFDIFIALVGTVAFFYHVWWLGWVCAGAFLYLTVKLIIDFIKMITGY